MNPAHNQDTLEIRGPSDPGTEVPAPFSSLIDIDLGASSHVGKLRANNEDSYLVFRNGRFFEPLATSLPENQLPARFEEVGYVMAVADGMGGHAKGEIASALALRTGVALVLNAAHWALKLDHVQNRQQEIEQAIERGREYFRRIHEAVTKEAQSDATRARMGTTLTATYSFGTDLFVLHVGDSRAYLFRRGMLTQLTHDHTLAQQLVAAGALTANEARTHRTSHILTQVIGGDGVQVSTQIVHRLLEDGDIVLVCSDGLTGMVPDDQIADILGQPLPASQLVKLLIDAALEGGGKDNITALVGRYRLP